MATVLTLPTSARRRIYQALVDQPGRHWTVRTLPDALATHASVDGRSRNAPPTDATS